MVGDSMAELLTAQYPSIDAILAASEKDLAAIKGFGPKRAESIYKFFHSPAGEKLVADLRDAGVKLTENAKPKAKGTDLTGKTFVVTGTLANYKRSDIENIIKHSAARRRAAYRRRRITSWPARRRAANSTRRANSACPC